LKIFISFEKKIEVPGMLALYQTCSNMGAVGISLASLEGKMAFDDLVEIPVAPKDVSWDVTLVYHESMEKVKAVKAFLDFLKEKLSDEGR
jgi:DNA-binding transcriptional LysR family regulator